MEYSTNSKIKKWSPGTFICFILTLGIFSFTPDRYLNMFYSNGSEFCPSGSAFLEPAFQNSGYSDSIRWNPPVDTIFNGFLIPFDSFELVQITGLPPGLTSQCDDPNGNCTWIANSANATLANIILSGNPGNANPAKYKVKIEVKYWVTLFGFPTSLTKTDSSHFIFLCPFENNSNQLEVVQVAPTINLTILPSSGYYFGLDGINTTAIVTNPTHAFFLSTKEVLFNPNFTIDAGAQLSANTCPE